MAIRALTAAAEATPTARRRLCTVAEGEGMKRPLTNFSPLYKRLSQLGANPGGSVEQTMQEWIKEEKFVMEFSLMKIVRELRRYRNYKIALELMDWMEARAMKVSATNYAIHLDLIAKVKGIYHAENYFSSLPDPEKNLQTYGSLLYSYCHELMVDDATALFDKMKELTLASCSLVYNNVMSLYLKLGQPDKVLNLFQEMKANNIRPDRFTCGILMSSYASLDDFNSVERIAQEMKTGGVAFDWATYAHLAAVYNSAGLFEKAESALKEAEGIMDKRNRNAFHFLINVYAGVGNSAEVNRVWKSLKAAFTKTTNKSYHVMLLALSKLDDIDALEQCFEEWESAYTNYDMKLANVMIGEYLRNDMLKEAESLCKKATEMGVTPGFRTVELFMDYFMKRHEMNLALKYFEVAVSQVEHNQWKPDKEKLGTFLKYFQEVKDVDRAEAFCQSLKKLNCLDGEAYEFLLRTYVAAGKKQPLLQKRIREDGIKLSSECEKLIETVCMND